MQADSEALAGEDRYESLGVGAFARVGNVNTDVSYVEFAQTGEYVRITVRIRRRGNTHTKEGLGHLVRRSRDVPAPQGPPPGKQEEKIMLQE